MSMDEKAWRSFIIGWTHPVVRNAEGKEIGPTSEDPWDMAKKLAANYNSKELNAIFSGVDNN